MKKIISTVLVVSLVLSAGMSTAFAGSKGKVPPGLAKKGLKVPPGIAKKIFNDLDNYPWAEDAIEKMNLKGLIKGYGDGIFAPRNAVTKLEAVIMALRVMGWEGETKDINELPKKYKGKDIADWAKGYITVAYEKEILDDVDMMYFNPQEPAKRHEVAKYVIRALGYEGEAEDHMDAELSFVDAAAVPVGSVGYVYMVNQMKIMQGDNEKRFNPMGTLTRAEMAVLFERVDDKVDSDIDEDELEGVIYRIDDDKITLRVNGQLKTYEVEDDIVVYDQDGRIDYDDIQKGNTAILQFEDDEVVYIEVVDEDADDDKIIKRYAGTVLDVDSTGDSSITLQNQTMKLIFEVTDDTNVYFKRVEGSFEDIEANDAATIVVDNKNRARTIYINRTTEQQTEKEIEGTITSIDLTGVYHISIDDESYTLSEDADVEIDGTNADLEDLGIGDDVIVKIIDDVVTSIEVENQTDEVEGIINDITQSTIKVKAGSEIKQYQYADVFMVYVNGQVEGFNDLEKGMDVELEVRNNLVYRIEASDNRFEIDGEIDSITHDSSGVQLTIDEGTEENRYAVSDDVEIEIDSDDDQDISDLEIDQEGTFEIVNNTIVEITIK
ncbi:S-layer homology domain-containing protein [Petroclostridium sp. X23]|uniref:S-layer homology domain-containing protein n=1 Tax=Petroclostridium sp. X23 TaxID=3045146 RepID=UPI0024ADCDB7|nr:S-layer homology domain-containing protein [Petroclostridium sp. X23]WHH60846.1 S-layer homology domain-containing protein [Petroclostridium sp. X23]